MDSSGSEKCFNEGATAMTQPLRFAPLVRVSTETQAKVGESLRTQTEQIKQYVKTIGGVIPEYCWEYSGQEHATPDQERIKLKKLLEDSSKGIFDAVIVCDASRWSRDNAENKRGLKILRDNNIRFFVAGMEHDLHSPEQNFILGMFAEFNELNAKQQNLKSIQNRIAKAKRGIPTAGRLPYGRTYDSNANKWGLDEKAAQNIKWAAEQYLAGKSMAELSKTVGISDYSLWEILTKRSGDKWLITFNPANLNVNETVEISVPPLLSAEKIQSIHERIKANKTYTHGEIKNKYLLSRMVFCADCGSALYAQTNHGGRQYYCHQKELKNRCNPSLWVRADILEEAVLHQLFHIYGDVTAMEKAIARAIPDPTGIENLRNQLVIFENQFESIMSEKQNLIRSIAKGILTDNEAAKDIQNVRERESLLTAEITKINSQLKDIPTKERIERSARLIVKVLERAFKSDGALGKMTYENKRELMTRSFAGKDAEGKRRGVYIRKTGNPERPWEFTIRGIFGEFIRPYPLTEYELEEVELQAGAIEPIGTKYGRPWPAPYP